MGEFSLDLLSFLNEAPGIFQDSLRYRKKSRWESEASADGHLKQRERVPVAGNGEAAFGSEDGHHQAFLQAVHFVLRKQLMMYLGRPRVATLQKYLWFMQGCVHEDEAVNASTVFSAVASK